jgi:hypothetical protein
MGSHLGSADVIIWPYNIMKPRVGRLILMLLICLLMLFVFGRMRQVVEFVRPPPPPTTNITIVAGTLVGEQPGDPLAEARYRVTEVLRGSLSKGAIIVVGYFSDTETHGLPTDALLVLTQDAKTSLPVYEAIGGDAHRGILTDSLDERKRVLAATADSLAPVPWANRLSETAAILLAQQSSSNAPPNLRWHGVRDGYKGWLVTAAPAGDDSRSTRVIYQVSDDGRVRLLPP